MYLRLLDPGVPRSKKANSNNPPSYSDNVAARALSGAAYNSGTQLTESACAAYCGTKGFKYAGVEYSAECCK